MGCGGVCCLKCLLITFNVFFGIIGVVFIALGAVLMTSVSDLLVDYLASALDSIPGLPGLFNLADGETEPSGGVSEALDLVTLLKPVAICILIFGVFLLIMSILGSFGACCNVKGMLYAYAAIVLALLVTQIILVALFFSGALDKVIKKQLQTIIDEKYVGIDGYDAYSIAWNAMMIELECCGIDGWEDFQTSTSWNDQRTLADNSTITLELPFACCKFNNYVPVSNVCANSPTDAITNRDAGCYDALLTAADDFRLQLIGGISGVLVFQAICAAAAIIIGVKLQKKNDDYA